MYGSILYVTVIKIGALIVKTTIVNFSYFEISVGMSTLMHILFNRRLRLFF